MKVVRDRSMTCVNQIGPHLVTVPVRDLDALGRALDLVDGATRGGRGLRLGQLLLDLGAVEALLEDGLDIVHVELGLEVTKVVEA